MQFFLTPFRRPLPLVRKDLWACLLVCRARCCRRSEHAHLPIASCLALFVQEGALPSTPLLSGTIRLCMARLPRLSLQRKREVKSLALIHRCFAFRGKTL